MSEPEVEEVRKCLSALLDDVSTAISESPPRVEISSGLNEPLAYAPEEHILIDRKVINVADNSTDEFWLKTIHFQGNHKRIVLQSSNGPCPLIAAINALILSSDDSIIRPRERTSATITRRRLTDIIGNILAHYQSNVKPAHQKDYEKTVQDIYDVLPKLGSGLEVNVRFRQCTEFEYTTSIALFDYLGLTLYHTWVVEPGTRFVEPVGNQTYNQVSAAAFESEVLSDFLDETGSQMTYTGLFELTDAMRNNKCTMAVLFRNNHFHTVHFRNNALYLLCSDAGYRNLPAVWEQLDNIHGDNRFVDADFRDLTSNNHTEPIHTSPVLVETVAEESVDSDLAMARRLDAELNRSEGVPPPSVPVEYRGAPEYYSDLPRSDQHTTPQTSPQHFPVQYNRQYQQPQSRVSGPTDRPLPPPQQKKDKSCSIS